MLPSASFAAEHGPLHKQNLRCSCQIREAEAALLVLELLLLHALQNKLFKHSTSVTDTCMWSVPNVYTPACSAAAYPPCAAVMQELTPCQELRKLVAMPSSRVAQLHICLMLACWCYAFNTGDKFACWNLQT